MTITTSMQEFRAAVWNTPFNAVALKKRGKTLQELFDDEYGHGVLVSPTIVCGMIHGPDELAGMMDTLHRSIVTVRGHGWSFEKPFVWTGSTAEFNQTWVID